MGDALFYDWQNDGLIRIQVGSGPDPNSGWWGDYVDQHTTDRYHAFWSLKPYNANYMSTTYIRVVHVSASN